jgi:pimeloyl-ACP methyl ester carboxylesterase
MYFDVNDKSAFATTGGKPFDHSRPAVIFLHGSGLDHTFWGLHSRFFAFRNYSVLVPDLPGHTNSAGPPLTSIESMADWLNEALDSVAADNISLVAHSQGCLVALEFAARYTDKVRSVSFIASGLATPVNGALLDAAENDPDSAIAMMLGWGFGSAGQLHQGPVPGNSMLEVGKIVMQRNAPNALAADLRACNDYQNGRTAAAAINCPVQVLLADNDRMAPRKAGMELVENLNSPELHIVAQSGHMIPLEAPDTCRRLLKDFIFSTNPVTWPGQYGRN